MVTAAIVRARCKSVTPLRFTLNGSVHVEKRSIRPHARPLWGRPPHITEQERVPEICFWVDLPGSSHWIPRICGRFCVAGISGCKRVWIQPPR